eukprot:TRINITY_DN42319_c0_g1_i1.p1 TRINITY_DN42319_c0_g1~~TRINITY_DN42319_c0_g1_i1.p1  ORF type:complete len:433 (-),score=24.55 TRINITY_DN42319_c0_g1_i1:135-1331(-)
MSMDVQSIKARFLLKYKPTIHLYTGVRDLLVIETHHNEPELQREWPDLPKTKLLWSKQDIRDIKSQQVPPTALIPISNIQQLADLRKGTTVAVVITHATPGKILLTGRTYRQGFDLSVDKLHHLPPQFWTTLNNKALTIWLFGCEVFGGTEGREFANQLAHKTPQCTWLGWDKQVRLHFLGGGRFAVPLLQDPQTSKSFLPEPANTHMAPWHHATGPQLKEQRLKELYSTPLLVFQGPASLVVTTYELTKLRVSTPKPLSGEQLLTSTACQDWSKSSYMPSSETPLLPNEWDKLREMVAGRHHGVALGPVRLQAAMGHIFPTEPNGYEFVFFTTCVCLEHNRKCVALWPNANWIDWHKVTRAGRKREQQAQQAGSPPKRPKTTQQQSPKGVAQTRADG